MNAIFLQTWKTQCKMLISKLLLLSVKLENLENKQFLQDYFTTNRYKYHKLFTAQNVSIDCNLSIFNFKLQTCRSNDFNTLVLIGICHLSLSRPNIRQAFWDHSVRLKFTIKSKPKNNCSVLFQASLPVF